MITKMIITVSDSIPSYNLTLSNLGLFEVINHKKYPPTYYLVIVSIIKGSLVHIHIIVYQPTCCWCMYVACHAGSVLEDIGIVNYTNFKLKYTN